MAKRILLQILFTFLLAEAVLALFFRDDLPIIRAEKSLIYQYDPVLGWSGIPNSATIIQGCAPFHVQNNAYGFRDDDHNIQKTKPRILVLGDSFVWGSDVERADRFDQILQKKMPEYEFINVGLSGYSTDQELILLTRFWDQYQPDVVFHLFCHNDRQYNNLNYTSLGYRKPMFEKTNGQLRLVEAVVPKCPQYFYTQYPTLSKSLVFRALVKIWVYFRHPYKENETDVTSDLILAIRSFAESRGAKHLMGFTRPDKQAGDTHFCQQNGIPFIDLSNPMVCPDKGNHWTTEGHRWVAEQLDTFLSKNLNPPPGLIQPQPQNDEINE